MKLEVVCTQKTLSIGFPDNFPSRLCSYEDHDRLSDILVKAIPEITGEGMDGGVYRQTRYVWIEIECEGMTDEREQEIRDLFLVTLKKFCCLK